MDDLVMFEADARLAVIDAHPNIHVRLFNPWRNRCLIGRALAGMAHFSQANRRMHTKLLVSDNRAMIPGGRNIANEYFGLSPKFNFHDLDVIAVGDTAHDGSSMFDHYWNSELAVPADLLSTRAKPGDTRKLQSILRAFVAESGLLRQVVHGGQTPEGLPRDWSRALVRGNAWLVYDSLDAETIQYRMADEVGQLIDMATTEVLVTNAYFIPEDQDLPGIKALCDRGVRLRLLTSSLGSHDVPAVNSHYRPWRKALVSTCPELHELRADAQLADAVNTAPVGAKHIGLHSKAAVVDRRCSFVGSFNFDPRSAALNAEMGLLVDSPQLGDTLARQMQRDMQPERSWQVSLDDDDKVVWRSTRGQTTSQPARGLWQRIQDVCFGLLPTKYF